MPAECFTCEGIVLGRNETGEHHWRLEVFSPVEGPVRALARRASAKRPQVTPPDLFSLVALELEKSARGQTFFIREARVQAPYASIGTNYNVLVETSAFSRVVWKNLTHAEAFDEIFALTQRALEAFARGIRPEVTHFKSLYLLARAEGYPVKEQMLASWSAADRALAHRILLEPLDGDQPAPEAAKHLLDRLQLYLKAHTDILV